MIDSMGSYDLITYLSLMTGRDIAEDKVLTNVNTVEMSDLILNSGVDFTKVKVPEVFTFHGEDKLVSELDDGTFKKRYMYDIFKQQYINDKITSTHLLVVALAIMLSKNDSNEIDKTYEELLEMNWKQVLPIGFFLAKNLNPKKISLTGLFRKSIINLHCIIKAVRLLITRKIHSI